MPPNVRVETTIATQKERECNVSEDDLHKDPFFLTDDDRGMNNVHEKNVEFVSVTCIPPSVPENCCM